MSKAKIKKRSAQKPAPQSWPLLLRGGGQTILTRPAPTATIREVAAAAHLLGLVATLAPYSPGKGT